MYQEKGEGCGLFGEPKNLRDCKFTASGAHQSADLSAVAQATGAVRIDNVRVESETTPIKNLSFVHVRWDWYAGNVSNGQQFSVEFPDVLKLGSDQGIELRDADGLVGGTCNADSGTRIVTCTFNDKFSNKDNVHGMFAVQVQVAKAQKSKEITSRSMACHRLFVCLVTMTRMELSGPITLRQRHFRKKAGLNPTKFTPAGPSQFLVLSC